MDVKLIGNENCNRCLATKSILQNKGIDFDYILLNNLPESEQELYIQKAQDCGIISFPIILKNNEVVKLEDII